MELQRLAAKAVSKFTRKEQGERKRTHRERNPRAYMQKDVLNHYGAEGSTVSVPLVAARLCLDCDVIYMADRCPRCCSAASMRVADYVPVMHDVTEKEVIQEPAKKQPKNLVRLPKKGGRKERRTAKA